MSKAKADGLFFAARRLEEAGKIVEALHKYDEIHKIDRMYDKAWFYKFKLFYQFPHRLLLLPLSIIAILSLKVSASSIK